MSTDSVLQKVEQRNFPLPTTPWVMKQNWLELLFAHWPVASALLRPLMPSQLAPDTFEGEAWVGIVPFRMTNVRPRGLPAVAGLSHFPELNVRTYVVVDGIPGVYFFSLDAANPLAVALAREFFHLPYFNALMSCERKDDRIDYHSHRTHRGAAAADLRASYRPTGPVYTAQRDSLEYWLTERYCLYSVFQQRIYRGNIHHGPWPLQPAELETISDTMARSHGIQLPDIPPLLHYAERQEVLIWPLRCIS